MEMKARGGADGMTDINISSPLAQDPRAPEMHDAPEIEDPLAKPTEGGPLAKVKWALLFPLYLQAKYTIPGTYKVKLLKNEECIS